MIDSLDTFYNPLRAWRDFDSNGTSEADELFGLNEVGIASINLAAI